MYRKIFLVAGISLAAACGSSTTTPTVTPTPTGSNGLPFASDDIAGAILGLETTQALTLIYNSIEFNEDGSGTLEVGTEFSLTYTPGEEPGDLESGNGTGVFVVGEETLTVEFVGGVADLAAVGAQLTLANEIQRVASVLLSVTETFEDDLISKEYFVVGFETSQADIDDLAALDAGSVVYTGEFLGAGVATNTGNDDPLFLVEQVDISGNVSIDVNFADTAVGGFVTIDSVLYGEGTNALTVLGSQVGTEIVLSIDETMLIGNGFTTTAGTFDDCADCVAGTVNSSSIDGVFYGSDAAEVSGLASFNVEVDDSAALDFYDDSFNLVGVGGYIASAPEVLIPLDVE